MLKVDNKDTRTTPMEPALQRCSYRKSILKICIKFTGEHPGGSAISIKLRSNLTEITLWHESFPVTLVHICRTHFLKNTSGGLLL